MQKFNKIKAVIIICFVAVFNLNIAFAKAPKEIFLERVDIVHYAKNTGKETASKKPNACYKLMGVKWGTTNVSYVVNPTNPEGLSDAFVESTLQTSAETWDAATSNELFNNAYSTDYSATYGSLDGKNAIAFGAYTDNSAIAVTSVWYNRFTKRIVEFDQIYNTNFTWGDAAVDSSVMDFQNIATHELGHAVGLSDIYTSACGTVTMYGYGTEGETQKRTLEAPDIQGLQKMYGI